MLYVRAGGWAKRLIGGVTRMDYACVEMAPPGRLEHPTFCSCSRRLPEIDGIRRWSLTCPARGIK